MSERSQLSTRSFLASVLLAFVIISLLGFGLVFLTLKPGWGLHPHYLTLKIAALIAILTLLADATCAIVCPPQRLFTRLLALFLILPSLLVTIAVVGDFASDRSLLSFASITGGLICSGAVAYAYRLGVISLPQRGTFTRAENPMAFWILLTIGSVVSLTTLISGIYSLLRH